MLPKPRSAFPAMAVLGGLAAAVLVLMFFSLLGRPTNVEMSVQATPLAVPGVMEEDEIPEVMEEGELAPESARPAAEPAVCWPR